MPQPGASVDGTSSGHLLARDRSSPPLACSPRPSCRRDLLAGCASPGRGLPLEPPVLDGRRDRCWATFEGKAGLRLFGTSAGRPARPVRLSDHPAGDRGLAGRFGLRHAVRPPGLWHRRTVALQVAGVPLACPLPRRWSLWPCSHSPTTSFITRASSSLTRVICSRPGHHLRDVETAERPLRGGWLATLGLLVVLAPWFSFPSAFIIAGCGIVLLIDRCAKRWWPEIGWLLAIALCWLGSFWLAYRASRALLHPATTMYVFWNFAFLPVPPGSRADLIKLGGVLLEVFVESLEPCRTRYVGRVICRSCSGPGSLPVLLMTIGGLSLAVRDQAGILDPGAAHPAGRCGGRLEEDIPCTAASCSSWFRRST